MTVSNQVWDEVLREEEEILRPHECFVDPSALEKKVLLGHGGQSKVYRVMVEDTPRAVAFFQPPPPPLADTLTSLPSFENSMRRFLRGYLRSLDLTHPNIEEVIGHFRDDKGHFCIVKELLTPRTLDIRLKEYEGRAHPNQHIRFLRDEDAQELLHTLIPLLDALEYTRSQGVVHRDLKPANVSFDEEGNPKLIDFGLGRLVNEQAQVTLGTVVGTQGFSAPEQMSGHPSSPAADVYSFGRILFRGLFGEKGEARFEADAMRSLLKDHPDLFAFEQEMVRQIRKQTTAQGVAGIEEVIYRSLSSDPARRDTPQELKGIMQRVIEGKPPYRFLGSLQSRKAQSRYAWSWTSPQSRKKHVRKRLVQGILMATPLLLWQAGDMAWHNYQVRVHDVPALVEGRISAEEASRVLQVMAVNQLRFDELNEVDRMITDFGQIPISSRTFMRGAYHTSNTENPYAGDFIELHLHLLKHAKGSVRSRLEQITAQFLSSMTANFEGPGSDAAQWARSRFALVARHMEDLDDLVRQDMLSSQKVDELHGYLSRSLCHALGDTINRTEKGYILRGDAADVDFIYSVRKSSLFPEVLRDCDLIMGGVVYEEVLVNAGLRVAKHHAGGRFSLMGKETKDGLRPIHQAMALGIMVRGYEVAREESERELLAHAIKENVTYQLERSNSGVFHDGLYYDQGNKDNHALWAQHGHTYEYGGVVFAAQQVAHLIDLAKKDEELFEVIGPSMLYEAQEHIDASLQLLFSSPSFSNPFKPLSNDNQSGHFAPVWLDTRYTPFIGPTPTTDLALVKLIEREEKK